MNQRKLTEVALIIFGVYALIRGISYPIRMLPNGSISMFFSWTLLPSLLSLCLPSLIYWLFAGLLFWYAPMISSKLFDADEDQEPTDALAIHDWYRLTFSVTGIVLFFWLVLPELVNGVNVLLFPLDLKDPENDQFGFFNSLKNMLELQLFRIFGNLVEGGIAIYLVLRANQLAGFIVKWQDRQPTVSSENLGK